jgi:hypothetical protein
LLRKLTYLIPVPALVALLLAVPVAAAATPDPGADQTRRANGGRVDARLGVGEARPLTVARIAPPVARFRRTIRVIRRQIRAEHRAEVRRRRREAFSTLPAGISQGTLDSIAVCESGGDPAAVSSDGSYRGKYQFDTGTWASVGGSGDPAAAPEAEQDYRAALLYASSGSSPWPICG